MSRIGIFGGTFSPPHNGHVESAKAFMRELSLDRLIVIPTNVPPHKQHQTCPPHHRLEMTRLAFVSIEGCEVSDYEINTPGKSYTANTLSHFHNGEDELFFLCGTDMFLTLHSWYKPELICSLANIVLVRRDNEAHESILEADSALKRDFGARTIFLENRVLEISSTQIRNLVAAGKDPSHLIPLSVAEYIKENRLYVKEDTP